VAVQANPIKPSTLKAPGTKRLKLKYDEVLSSVAFNLNLRRYSMVCQGYYTAAHMPDPELEVRRCRFDR